MPSLSAHVGAREARASGVRFAADAAAAARGGGDAANTATSAAPARLPPKRAVARARARRRSPPSARRRPGRTPRRTPPPRGCTANPTGRSPLDAPRASRTSSPRAKSGRTSCTTPGRTAATKTPPRGGVFATAWASSTPNTGARGRGRGERTSAPRPRDETPHAPFPSGPRREYLRSIGLEPETRADGSWIGDDPNAIDPMDHPAHPFNALVRRRGVE